MSYSYSAECGKENARAVGMSLPISTKQAVEICASLRGQKIERARKILKDAIDKKAAIKYRRYNKDVGHKKVVGPGRYPVKACGEILKIVNSVSANAQAKGMGADLIIKHISAQKASSPWHYGRQIRRKMKRTHIEIIVAEAEKPKERLKKEKMPEKKPEELPKKEENPKNKAEAKNPAKGAAKVPKKDKK
ncbi:MAG: 50S ribosomal protein L22 [archaeon]